MDDHRHGGGDPSGIEQVLARAPQMYEESVDFTLGVEEEFAIVDTRTLDLAQRFEDVEAAARNAGLTDAVCGELIASEVEFRTGRCERYEDAVREVLDNRVRAAEVVSALGLSLGATGVHPWADYRDQRIIDNPYYLRLVDRLQFISHRNNTFGLHVHVGVRGRDRAIAVCDGLREHVPELLALSASSPFFERRDSGLASMRSIVFGRLFPRAGIPPVHGDWSHYEAMVRTLRDVGSIESYGQMWWHVRPHALHGTIELRMFDAQPDARDTLALVAFAQGLVAHLCARIDAGDAPAPTRRHLIDENLWRASRYGLSAELVDFASGHVQPIGERIAELVGRARDASRAADLGIEDGLDRIEAMAREGGSASWQRVLHNETGDLSGTFRATVERSMSTAATVSEDG